MARTPLQYLTIWLALLSSLACENTDNLVASFETTVQEHFEAINERNIDRLMKTVDSERVSLILPSGTYSSTATDYQQVNVDWFADPNWSIQYELVEQRVHQQTGIALTKITYSDQDEEGQPYSFDYYLTLVFERQNGAWKLVFDQNTVIK